LGEEPAALLDGLGERKEALATQALSAGAATTLDEKIVGLGRVLADGLASEDDARLDEFALLLAALADLEAPHLRVLAWFAEEGYYEFPVHPEVPWADAELRWDAYSRADVEADFEQYGIGLDGVFATLTRHGLIAELAPDISAAFEQYRRRGLDGQMGRVTNQARRWRVTPLGVTTVRYVEDRAKSAEAPPAGGALDLN
jgi:hypothetical protein